MWLQVVISTLTVAGMVIMFIPSCRTVSAYSISKTTIMHIPFSYIYFPFLIFLILSSVHELGSIALNIGRIFGHENETEGQNSEDSMNFGG